MGVDGESGVGGVIVCDNGGHEGGTVVHLDGWMG